MSSGRPPGVAWLAGLLALAGLAAVAAPAMAVPFDNNPKILLHLRPVTGKNPCEAGVPGDCRNAVTEGSTVNGTYFAYLLAARGSLPDIGGVQLGLTYENGCASDRANGTGIDIYQWTLCATLQFSSPSPAWPNPGSGNLITWDVINACQTGESAVAGYFYMGWYGQPDVLRVIPRPSDGLAKLVDCGSLEVPLPSDAFGSIAFSPGGATPGCNPCDAPCPLPAVLPNCGPLLDVIPPGAITDLMVINPTSNSLQVRWTAPAEDGLSGGPVTAYDIRYSTAPINDGNFASATSVAGINPASPGTLQTRTIGPLSASTTYYVAMKSDDEVPNTSALSNVANGTTSSGPPDFVAPGVVTIQLQATSFAGITLEWHAPGDDGYTGTAAQYDLRYRTAGPISTTALFDAATPVVGEPAPSVAGTLESFQVTGLAINTDYHFALRTIDEAGNVSLLSNSLLTRIASAPPSANANTRLVLHVVPAGPATCGSLGALDCSGVNTRADLEPASYHVYLLAFYFAELGGIECGITYDDGQPGGLADHDEVDVYGWTRCADLEFPSPNPAWPAPGSGTLLTWSQAGCRVPPVAVGGFFYVGAYGADWMRITPRPASGAAKVATCASAETVLPVIRLGEVAFSAGASVGGFNPCLGPAAVERTTWTRIKGLVGGTAPSRPK